jgi:hypothetical protein
MKQTLKELKGETDMSTISAEDFNTSFSTVARITREQMNWKLKI